MMRYCSRCVLPDTKPDLTFDKNGICNACLNFETRSHVNWNERYEQLLNILKKYRSRERWDCIVPVSGGKDSTYQVIKLLEFGMNPLCVTSRTCDLSDIGALNIENIKKLGVDHIDFSPKKGVRAILNRIGLMEVGDISWPEHVGIFTIPVQIAVKFRIPLIVWGENSQNEYGGPATATTRKTLDREWLEEFGGLLGLRVSDLAATYGVSESDLLPYRYPDSDELDTSGVTGIFLGYFLPWDGYTNALLAQANGMTVSQTIAEGSMVNYENLDNYQTGVHDYFKYLKFGFGRASDIASLHIRRGRLSRSDAIDLVEKLDGKFPWTYLGKKLQDILSPLNISIDEFKQICDQFTNRKIFMTDKNDNFVKDENGRPVKYDFNKLTSEYKYNSQLECTA